MALFPLSSCGKRTYKLSGDFLCVHKVLGLSQDLTLAGQVLHHLSRAPSPFHFGYFSDSILLFAQDSLGCSPLIYISHVAEVTVCHHDQILLVEMRISGSFCLCWPRTVIQSIAASFPITASQEAGITGVYHWRLAFFFFFFINKVLVHFCCSSKSNKIPETG
jgi:hypothetical protein